MASTQSTPSGLRLQQELKKTMRLDQTWQAPPSILAKILSPKALKREGGKAIIPPTELELSQMNISNYFDILVEQESKIIKKALKKPGASPSMSFDDDETLNYGPAAAFLNTVLDQDSAIYKSLHKKIGGLIKPPVPLLPEGQHWLKGLRFFPYDRPTADHLEGADPLKPDVLGTQSELDSESCCSWKRRQDGIILIEIVVEVKAKWPELRAQLATYARAQFNACPFRAFVVGIGISHEEHTLRFFIFHRGGVTMSEKIQIDGEDLREGFHPSSEVVRVLLSIYLWKNSADAGFPSFTNGHNLLLPNPTATSTPVPTVVTQILYQPASVSGRNPVVFELHLGHPHPPPDTNFRQKSQRIQDKADQDLAASFKYYDLDPVFHAPQEVVSGGQSMPDTVIAKLYWSGTSTSIEPQVYQACSGDFGTPIHVISYAATGKDSVRVTNGQMLPPQNDTSARTSFEKLYAEHEYVRLPEHRTLWVVVTLGLAESLENCTSSWDLVECIMHAVIGKPLHYSPVPGF